MRWSPSFHVPVLVVLAAACLALSPALIANRIPARTDLVGDYGPWLTGGSRRVQLSGGDSFFVYPPDRLAAVREWKAGHLPLWNAYLGGGMPMLGMQTANPLDPLIALHLAFTLGRALGIAYAMLLFIAGCGMMLFLRARGVKHPAALAAAGVAFALNPYFLSWLELRVFLAGLATLPLALWALDGLVLDSPKLRRAGILALALGYASLAGTLQTLAIFLAIIVLRLLWNFVTRPRSPQGLTPIGIALILGLCIGILPLISGGELLHHSTRLQSARGYYATSNFLPWRSTGLWMNHELFGRIVALDSPFWNVLHRTPQSSSGWGALGIVPLFLALFALLRRAGPRRERIFWGGLSGIVLAFLFLMQTGFARVVQSLWPGIHGTDLLRGLFLVNLSGAVLTGWGLEALIKTWRARNPIWILAFGAYLVFGVIAVLAAVHGFHLSLSKALLPLLLVGGAMLIIGAIPSLSTSTRGWLLVTLIALDLGRMHFRINPFCDPNTAYPHTQIIDDLKTFMGSPDYPRFLVFGHLRIFPPNTAAVFELPDLRSYSNVPIANFRHFLEWAEEAPMANQEFLSHVDSPIYRMLGVRYLFSQPTIAAPGYVKSPLTGHPTVDFYRRPDALPRAYLVHDVVRVETQDALRSALVDPQFDPAAHVHLVGDAGLSIAAAPNHDPDRVRIRERTSTRVVIDVTTDAPGVLVLSDVFYPGWHAQLNGRNTTILPAYGGLRGVSIPAGSSQIIMHYRPAWLWPGILVSLLALAAAIWLTITKQFNASAIPSSS